MKKLMTIIFGVIFTVLGVILSRVSGDQFLAMTKEAYAGYGIILLGAFLVFKRDRVVAFWKNLSSEEED